MAVNVVKLVKLFEAALDVLQKNKLKMMVEGGSFIFFFLFHDEVYGASEASRVMFAKMKDPNDDDGKNPGWLKEAKFSGTNLNKMGQGMQIQMLFSDKDLPNIDVVSKDEALSKLEDFYEREKDTKMPQQ